MSKWRKWSLNMKTKRSWTELAAPLSHRELLFALCCRWASDEAASAASGRRKQKPRDALWAGRLFLEADRQVELCCREWDTHSGLSFKMHLFLQKHWEMSLPVINANNFSWKLLKKQENKKQQKSCRKENEEMDGAEIYQNKMERLKRS